MHKKSGRSRATVMSSHLSSRPVALEVICRHIGSVHQDHAKACFLHCSLKGLHETGLVCACMAISLHSRHSMHSTAQHGAAQHSTAQHSTAQHSTAQTPVLACCEVRREQNDSTHAAPLLIPKSQDQVSRTFQISFVTVLHLTNSALARLLAR